LRRQAANSRVTPAGSGRVERLDPFALPLRFHDVDDTADQRVRLVELHRERVVLRRTLCGIKMAVNLPVSAYLGVVIRIEPSAPKSSPKASPKASSESSPKIAVVLEHRDRALSLTLCRTPDGSDVVAQWRCWGARVGDPPAGRGSRRAPARTVRENGPSEHRNPMVAPSKPNFPSFAARTHGTAARTRSGGVRARRASRARDHRPQLKELVQRARARRSEHIIPMKGDMAIPLTSN
jgi:hypothetical protein